MKKCIGYGIRENICTNPAGTKWSPHWCEQCNKLRMDEITKQLENCLKTLENCKNKK